MKKSEIPVFEASDIEEEIEGPAVIIKRGQPSDKFSYEYYGTLPATYIQGIDDEGHTVSQKRVIEYPGKETRITRAYQKSKEWWRIRQVRSSLGGSAVELSHSELRENGL